MQFLAASANYKKIEHNDKPLLPDNKATIL